MSSELNKPGVIKCSYIVEHAGEKLYLYSTKQLAYFLGIHEQTVRDNIRKGIFPKPTLRVGTKNHQWLAAEAEIIEEAYARFGVRRGVKTITPEFKAYIEGQFLNLYAKISSRMEANQSIYGEDIPAVLYVRHGVQRSTWSAERRLKFECKEKERKEVQRKMKVEVKEVEPT